MAQPVLLHSGTAARKRLTKAQAQPQTDSDSDGLVGWTYRQHEVIGNAYESLLCGILEANNLTLSITEVVPSQRALTSRVT